MIIKKSRSVLFVGLQVFSFMIFSCKNEKQAITVITSPVTSDIETSFNCGGTVSSDESVKVVERGICWSKNPNPTVDIDRIIEGSGIGSFTCRLSNLDANTTYYVRAYALNRSGTYYGDEKTFTTSSIFSVSKQIIADHTVVAQFDKIPQHYIDEVKKMLVAIGGESHASGYRRGMELLMQLDSKYHVKIYVTEPVPEYSENYLRFGQPFALGEQIYTSASYVELLKSVMKSYSDKGSPFNVFGFGWCYDMTWENPPRGKKDAVFNVRWAGTSLGGPDGNQRWGLDKDDQVLTGNSVCMDTYLSSIDLYNHYCESNDIITKFIFTTGPVDDDSGTETGFQRELKHNYIRNYVFDNPEAVLFDYADILCYNDKGEKHIVVWNNKGTKRPHEQIHPDNLKDYNDEWNIINPGTDTEEDHIGEVGALRLAKAMWWMLARIAGWDGESPS
jgi:hypothetical protein